MNKTLQLQFWDNAKRVYVPSTMAPVLRDGNGTTKALSLLADAARLISNQWRIASTERSLKPKYQTPRPTSSSRSSRSIEDVQVAYVTWANAKGLSHITIYKKHAGKPAFARWYGAKTYITEEEHFAVLEELV